MHPHRYRDYRNARLCSSEGLWREVCDGALRVASLANDLGLSRRVGQTRWVAACWDNGQLYDPHFYSPDPANIFSGVVVCVAEVLNTPSGCA